MKSYKTWEVIKMLTENPKLKFQDNYKQEISIINGTLSYEKTKSPFVLNIVNYVNENNSTTIGTIEVLKWNLVQEPVPFMEAIAHMQKGGIARQRGLKYYFSGGTLFGGNFAGNERNGCGVNFKEYMLENNWIIEEE